MQDKCGELEARGITVVAVAQEDPDLEKHGRILKLFEGQPCFEIVADLDRRQTGRYHRTTTYLIDPQGVIRQVFPMTIHHRAPWEAIFEEVAAAAAAPRR